MPAGGLLAALAAGACHDDAPVSSPPDAVAWRCEDWARIESGPYALENNVWNKGDETDYEQCVAHEGAPGGGYRWRWRWPDGGSGGVKAFPAIIHGWKPWEETPVSDGFPVPLADLERARVAFRVTSQGEGVRNLAFDVWLTRSSRPTPESISEEVMIWIDNEGMRPAGALIGQVVVDGAAYDLYRGPMQTWTYFAFVSVFPRRQGALRIDAFLGYLVETGHLSPERHLASIELGNEISGGRGQTRVEAYSVRVEAAPRGDPARAEDREDAGEASHPGA